MRLLPNFFLASEAVFSGQADAKFPQLKAFGNFRGNGNADRPPRPLDI